MTKNEELANRLKNVAYILEQSENSQNTHAINELTDVANQLSSGRFGEIYNPNETQEVEFEETKTNEFAKCEKQK